jgi:hypothetical protein
MSYLLHLETHLGKVNSSWLAQQATQWRIKIGYSRYFKIWTDQIDPCTCSDLLRPIWTLGQFRLSTELLNLWCIIGALPESHSSSLSEVISRMATAGDKAMLPNVDCREREHPPEYNLHLNTATATASKTPVGKWMNPCRTHPVTHNDTQ